MQGSKTVFGNAPHLYVAGQGQRLDFTLTADRHVLGRDATLADLAVPSDWATVSGYHAVLLRRGDDYWIVDGVNPNTGQPSTNGLLFQNTRIADTEASGPGLRLAHGAKLQIGQNPVTAVTLTYFDPVRALALRESITPNQSGSIDLSRGQVLLGRSVEAAIELNSPLVSRHHATIERSGSGYVLHDLSTNGTFINGLRVNKQAPLPDNAVIKIGPFTLVRRGDRLDLSDEGSRIRLDADRLSLNGRRLKWVGLSGLGQSRIDGDKTTWLGLQSKQTFPRLQNVTIPIEPGQLVALVGGSGAGKSTLMRTLLGIEKTDTGTTYINSTALRDNFNLYRNQIGYVPQQDILHRDLTVQEALTYTAKLRLPKDQSLSSQVEKALQDVDMAHKANDLVRDLSGGQLKRVSIAAELIADPKLFFLDEPTSGLDPGLDKKMMQLLRKLAKEDNRTIVLVTHATANISLCDRVAFLGRGGKLCYFGPPQDALDFFHVESGDFADIYLALEPGDADATSQAVNRWAAEFRDSKDYATYVDQRLVRQEANPNAITKLPSPLGEAAGQSGLQRSPIRQWQTLSDRYLRMVGRDQLKLAIALLTGPLAIGLTCLAVRNFDVLNPSEADKSNSFSLALKVLFVFTCAGLWVGLSGAIQEIVKEQEVYSRERLVNLGLLPYIASKLAVLGGLSLIQTTLMAIVIALGFKHPEPTTLPWFLGVSITTFLTLLSSLSLGLLISSGTRNSSQANTLVPLILLPQIIFSGVLFKMEGIGEYISWLMLGRWSVGAYGSLVDVNKMIPQIPTGSAIKPPFEPTPAYEPSWGNLGWNFTAFGIHILVYWVLILLIQKRKDLI